MLVENLRAAWRTFRRAGVERLVAARPVERRDEVDSIRRALPGAELFVVALEVSEHAREARLRARDTGSELADHLREARRLEPGLADLAVLSEGRTPREIAHEILAAAGW